MKKEKRKEVEDDSTVTEYTYERDISIRWTARLLKLVGMWLAKDPAEQRWRNFMFVYSVAQLSFGVCVQTRDFYFSWPDLQYCIYVACNILSLILVITKLLLIYSYKEAFIDLLMYTHKNVWFSKYNPTEQVMINKCKKLCVAATVAILLCANGSLCGYVLTSFLALFHITDNMEKNHSTRILPFNMWVDLPLSGSPQYEILYVLQVLSLYHVGICYICFDNFLCIVNLYIGTQFRILRQRLTNLGGISTEIENKSVVNSSEYTDKCYAVLKDCVRKHQEHISYCNRVNHVFTTIVLIHVLVFNVLLGLVSYEAFLAKILVAKRLNFIFNIMGSLIQLLGFTYSCDDIMEESSQIGTAIYLGPWTRLPMNPVGKMIRKDLRIIILRSRKPCCLSAGKFFPICLETFTTVVSTAMSYLTLVRQSMMN